MSCTKDHKNENLQGTGFKEVEVKQQKLKYPTAPSNDTISDTYFGEVVKDPFRPLEDDYSDETVQWVDEEIALFNDYMKKIPFRQKLRDRLEDLYNYEKISAPFKRGDYYYFYRNDGLQPQFVLLRTKDLSDSATVILDPNKLSTDGTVSLSQISFNKKGDLMAFAISKSGSDWNQIYVMRLDDGEILEDEINWTKFSEITWFGDGFFYSAFPKPDEKTSFTASNEHMKVYYHTLGTSQDEDQLIYEDPENEKGFFGVTISQDQRFLTLMRSFGTSGNDVFIKDLSKGIDSKFIPVVKHWDSDWRPIGHANNLLYFITNDGASNWQIISFDYKNNFKRATVIKEKKSQVIDHASIFAGALFVTYKEDVTNKIYKFGFDGKQLNEVKLPGPGTVLGFGGLQQDSVIYYSFTSFQTPNTILKYRAANNETSVFHESVLKNIDMNDYVTEQIFYPSRDSTMIPMYVVYKKGMELNGNNPTWLYGYGGFNISIMPGFRSERLAWLEQGGIYVSVNLRGGGEFGEAWHKAGTKLKKQNVFNDFMAAAEYLIANKYTSPLKLAINGASNGGLLVGACMTQRPDLFQVALPGVGVLDMLRYEQFTIGAAWASDYGSVKNEDEYKALRKYSPLHNIRRENYYPATMVYTADHDDRVVPAHSFKFTAALQKWQNGNAPILIRIDKKAGHGAGKPTAKLLDEKADLISFMMYNMNVEPQY